MTEREPVIFSSLGDECGIGPEIVARCLEYPEATEGAKRVIIGNRRIFDMGREVAGVTTDVKTFTSVTEAIDSPEPIVFYDYQELSYPEEIRYGENMEQCGATALAVSRHVVDLSRKGLVDAFTFGPVNKYSMMLAGSHFEGYKAYFADYMGFKGLSQEINTIGDLWTTRVTSHIPISQVASEMDKDLIVRVLRYFDRELRRFGYGNPKIAVAGLNPHNGDGGAFGREEIDTIGPAVEEAKTYQMNVAGPFPADTIFLTVREENYDGVLSMYHDQGQIATKLLGFDEGVTYFGGLPFIITTCAHGSAFDIAGQGKARPNALRKALELARRAVLKERGTQVEKKTEA